MEKEIIHTIYNIPPDTQFNIIKEELDKLPNEVFAPINGRQTCFSRHPDLLNWIFFCSISRYLDEPENPMFIVDPINDVCGECHTSEEDGCIHLQTLKTYILGHAFARN